MQLACSIELMMDISLVYCIQPTQIGTQDIKYRHHEITGGTENKKYRSKLER
jgi:hypothetical protein